MSNSRKISLIGLVLIPLLAGGFVMQQREEQDGARLLDQVLQIVSGRFVDSVGAASLYEKAARGLVRELNDRLPSSIAVLECVEAAPAFHARHDAVSRAYFYQISTRKTALSKRFVWWIKEPLDVERMQQAAALIAGRHDFVAFRAADPSKPGESTIVVVDSAEVSVDGDAHHVRLLHGRQWRDSDQ